MYKLNLDALEEMKEGSKILEALDWFQSTRTNQVSATKGKCVLELIISKQ
jgi:hypothetical protein